MHPDRGGTPHSTTHALATSSTMNLSNTTASTHKRQLSSADPGPDSSKKARQEPSDISPSISTLESEDLALKSRLDEAYAFILSRNLVNGKDPTYNTSCFPLSRRPTSPHPILTTHAEAPSAVLTHLLQQPYGTGLDAYVSSLVTKLRQTTEPMSEETDEHRRTGFTSDNMSDVADGYLDYVQKVRDMQATQPRAREVAYKLILDTQAESYGDMGASYGERPSDLDRSVVGGSCE